MGKIKDELQVLLEFKNEKPLLAIWDVAPFMLKWSQVSAKDYYLNPEIKMKTQLNVQKHFPEAIMFPGIWADFGNSVEMSAFGAKIKWFKNDAPYSQPLIVDINEVKKLKVPNPQQDGLMPKVLEQYKFFWNNLDNEYIDEYGYLEGVAFSVGPIEIAALLRGYGKFYLDLFDNFALLHQLLEKTTDLVIKWIKAQARINGTIKRLFLSDHVPSQINKKQFEEFVLPYFKKIFNEFSGAMILYHNEGNVNHIVDKISMLDFDVFHFGDNLETVKSLMTHNVCLMGNLHPINDIIEKNSNEIKFLSKKIIKKVGAQGLLLSSGGGMAYETTLKNVKAMNSAINY